MEDSLKLTLDRLLGSHTYNGTSLIRTLLGQKNVSRLVRCPDFRGCNVNKCSVWGSDMCSVCKASSC